MENTHLLMVHPLRVCLQVKMGALSCRAYESFTFSHAHCAWHVPLIFSFESLGFDSKACVILCALVLQEIVVAHTKT